MYYNMVASAIGLKYYELLLFNLYIYVLGT